MRPRKFAPILGVAAACIAAALFLGFLVPSSQGHSTPTSIAPNFTLTDIYGHTFNISDFRNRSVVVTEFTALSCAECQVVMQSLRSLYASYNQSGTSPVHIVSVYTEPQFGDSIPALKSYHTKNNITWTMAQDTNSATVSQAYGVTALPTVVIIDKHGNLVYDVTGVQDATRLHSTIQSALAGTATTISLVTVSVFALAALAGVTTFFSPCAFPMLPGYMGLFLGLNAKQSETPGPARGTYRGAARRAVLAGSVTAFGMVLVFMVLGIALIFAASFISGYVPYLLIAVGITLVVLGALLLTNLQYWKIIAPLQALGRRLRGKGSESPLASPVPAPGKGLYLKLFSYGMGYAAAAAGCVAPVIFSAIIAGLALGLTAGVINILIFSVTAAALMIIVTVMLALAGQKYVNQLKAWTPVIKKISAVVLVVVGLYLIYFYYTAWIA